MPITPAFTKLQRSIITSSIWLEDAETRLVWITLLAICDRDGIARVSDSMLAHTARVSEDGCEKAIGTLMAPDADSLDRGDGRRIERVTGGFYVINYLAKLSEGLNEEQRTAWRAQKAEQRAKRRADGGTVRPEHRDDNGKSTRKKAKWDGLGGEEHDGRRTMEPRPPN